MPVAARVEPLSLPSLLHRLDVPGAAVVTVDGWRVAVADPVAVIDTLGDLPAVDALGPAERVDDDTPPLAAGWVGMITDDVSRPLLTLPSHETRPAIVSVPELWFGCYDSALIVAPDGRAWGAAADLAASGPATSAATRAARWARWAEQGNPNRDHGDAHPDTGSIAGPGVVERPGQSPGDDDRPVPPGPQWSMSEAEHRAAVRQAQEWIAAGDCYQINLTAQVAAGWPGTAATLAGALWQASPASHAAFLQLPGDVGVVSISPETFLKVRRRTAAVRPIKGTRPRRSERAADAAQGRDLRGSAKDAAEHVMIVDLERNDLGRVCRTGTVRVPELAALEAHPSVWHLTSTVTGELDEGVGVCELVRATFPSGSIVGAPKRKAWQRASELEPVRRGVYCGSIGTITPRGVDLSVAIRTAVVHDGWASYGTGGGIVADSDPDEERQETVDKARPFLDAVARTSTHEALS